MTDANLSLIVYGKDDMRLEERPTPEPGPKEVQISMRSVGVCGSDLSFWVKGRLGNLLLSQPKVMGHEPSGVISKVGSEVTHLKVGDRVAVEPLKPCSDCSYCRRGLYNHCSKPVNSGCITRYICHPANFVYRLPDNMSFDEGALVQPLALAFYACERVGLRAGQNLLVTGAGCLGMSVVLAAKAYGANKICVTDVIPERLDFIRKIGADVTALVKEDEDPEVVAQRLVGLMGNEPDVSIETSGSQSATSTTIYANRSHGMVLQVGFSTDTVQIPLVVATFKELDIRGNHTSRNSYPAAIEAISSGRVNVKQLISHRFSLEESINGFTIAANKSGSKVIIDCSRPNGNSLSD
ncbi:hypothetical protein EGW08_020932 [Elysia chlorotica]|uniref:Sorbitol dehydrogenase n=1 Tax=Elysia chlorotica TaxID=188477 RepID=A0A3S0ZBQ8_ELYCH|nr:hypothetical protein EGW08_020932 [Elysia chlorotica]